MVALPLFEGGGSCQPICAEALLRPIEPLVPGRDRALLLCLAAALAGPSPVLASLGGGPVSVTADRAHLSARLRAESLRGRPVHVLTLANGAERREFARSDGTVYAIAWQGRSRPDLRQLMGPWFATYNAQVAASGARRARRPVEVRRSDLVVHAQGYMTAFWGYAYLPPLAPADFQLTDLKPAIAP